MKMQPYINSLKNFIEGEFPNINIKRLYISWGCGNFFLDVVDADDANWYSISNDEFNKIDSLNNKLLCKFNWKEEDEFFNSVVLHDIPSDFTTAALERISAFIYSTTSEINEFSRSQCGLQLK